MRGEFFEKMEREEDSLMSEWMAFHRRMEEAKYDLVREANLPESGERFRK